jgi:tRNA threonylcarbamoyladenosine biosynthesis protein TsaE
MKITLADLAQFAKDFLDSIESFASDKALLVALSGNLGAGKTTFTQKIAEQLNIPEKITSPTFVLMKKYSINFGQFKNLIHIDAYRLEDAQELSML